MTAVDDALTDPVFEDLFAALRAQAEVAAPPVGPDLAALLGGAVPIMAARGRRRRHHRIVALVGVGVLASGVSAAAAADRLPAPAQGVVATVINGLTPFHVPHPAKRPKPAGVTPSPAPVPAVVPTTDLGDSGQAGNHLTRTKTDAATHDAANTATGSTRNDGPGGTSPGSGHGDGPDSGATTGSKPGASSPQGDGPGRTPAAGASGTDQSTGRSSSPADGSGAGSDN